MRLLVVEDDRPLATVIARGLREEGHAVDVAHNLVDATHAATSASYDLVLLDLGLPDGDGLTLCRQLRDAQDGTPVLVLTARDGVADKVRGLDAGADDYLTKPFDFPELAARVRALLRRPGGTRSPELTCGDLTLDPASRRVYRGGVLIPLTSREFSLLHFLMARAGEVVSRTELLEHVWDANYDGLSNVVDVHVRNLRRKLELPGVVEPIETVRGAGYRLVNE